jgi:hypothetical protein
MIFKGIMEQMDTKNNMIYSEAVTKPEKGSSATYRHPHSAAGLLTTYHP